MKRIKERLQNLASFIKKYWLRILGVVFVLVGLCLLIWAGYAFWPDGSGLGSYTDADGKLQREKTVWDWMELLIIPAVLTIGALIFNKAEKENEMRMAKKRNETEQSIALDRQREAALQAYIDKMTELLLNKDTPLRKSNKDDEVRVVARTRTLTTLNSIDLPRKKILLQFLFEADLINKEKRTIDLTGANLYEVDLTGADLHEADLSVTILSRANLSGANLRKAHLNEADLSGAILLGTDLSGANLWRAHLNKADLSGVNLGGAFLSKADLSGVNLDGANLSRANLRGANLRGVDLRGVDLNGADLTNAHLDGADLSGANLDGADLSGAYLDGADLRWAILSGAVLDMRRDIEDTITPTPSQLSLVMSLEGAIMPDGLKYDPAIHPLPRRITKKPKRGA